ADVRAKLESYAGVEDVEAGVVVGKPQLDITLLPAASSLGLASNDIARQIRSAFYGAEALRQQEGRNEVKIVARLPVEERRSVHDVESMLIRTPSGGEVPLVEVAEIARARSAPTIERADGGRIVHVKAEIDEAVTSAGVVLETLTKDVLVELPDRYPGLAHAFGGENREQRETMQSLARGGIMALLVIYALLAIPFKSYVQPIIVMMAIPFGLVGAVLGHMLMGYSLSMVSMMGMVALIGVVVNDSLVLIDAANRFRRDGLSHLESIIAAGLRRFRPILLTSITTFLGLMPMILETSVQARFLIPMAISLGFGVLFATFIVLLLIPAFYMVLEDVRQAIAWLRERLRRLLYGGAAERDDDDEIEIVVDVLDL
ncbi:MAG: efflux RND transporter permease subunit, partial [Myxococcales bacterium]|nr:efflux RND transporter permease subunit [Myxococcales bacterium]